MRKQERERYKKLLLGIMDEFKDEINHLKSEELMKSPRDAAGDLSGYPISMADVGTDNFERDLLLDVTSNAQLLFYEVEEALRRIKEKTFGKCERCCEKIDAERLKARPYSRLCIKCQEELEKKLRKR